MRYHLKRKRAYPVNYSVEEFDPAIHQESCYELLDKWIRQKAPKISDDVRHKFEAESLTSRKTIECAPEIDLRGIVVVIDGRVAGFTFGESMNPNVANVMVEKTDLTFKKV